MTSPLKIPAASPESPAYMQFCLAWLQIWWFPQHLFRYDNMLEWYRKCNTYDYLIIMKDTNEDPDEKQIGWIQKGPRTDSVSVELSWVPPSFCINMLTSKELLLVTVQSFHCGFITYTWWIISLAMWLNVL